MYYLNCFLMKFLGSAQKIHFFRISKEFLAYTAKNNTKLIFVICGSTSFWIEKILNSASFVGRILLTIRLGKLLLSDCNRFWPKNIPPCEKFKERAVISGLLRYLEE